VLYLVLYAHHLIVITVVFLHVRWHLSDLASVLTASTGGSVRTTTLPVSHSTPSQRYNTAMAYLQPIASTLAALPPSRFLTAIHWLEQLDEECRSRVWEPQPETDDDVSMEPCSSSNTESEAASLQELTEDDNMATDQQDCEVLQPQSQDMIQESDIVAQMEDNQLMEDDPQSRSAGEGPSQVVLTLRQPVRQYGRPARQRQRLFKKKTMPIERLSAPEADSWRLKHVVLDEAAAAAVRTGRKCTVADIRPIVDVCLITEERFKLADLEQYFEPTAWDSVSDYVNSQLAADPQWNCRMCGSNVAPQSGGGRWVQCDRCLVWLHFECVGLKRKPRCDFYCTDCK